MYNKNKQYWKIPVHPDHILEIHLKPETWAKIVRIAKLKKTTYSWVVRYCIFRLIKRKEPRNFIGLCTSTAKQPKFKKLHSLAKTHVGAENTHRHKLCLYGDDEFFIRMSAAALYCTMSHLIRLALEWNLDNLERTSRSKIPYKNESYSKRLRLGFHGSAFYWLGIKLYADIELPTRLPNHKDFRLLRFERLEYW